MFISDGMDLVGEFLLILVHHFQCQFVLLLSLWTVPGSIDSGSCFIPSLADEIQARKRKLGILKSLY